MRRAAEALIKFYGLPSGSGCPPSVRIRTNAAVVVEAAWAQRKRESQLDEPPMIWIRGGRVYDLAGDRGTVLEFESDLLVRQVEDDPICRQRRREQGLMPFPFVAVPLKRDDDEDPSGAAAPPGCGEPSSAAAALARRRHRL